MNRPSPKQDVAVIGGGVSGLTTAIVLGERGHRVELFAGKIGMDTTSGRAAAIWFPHHIGNPNDDVSKAAVKEWARATFHSLQSLIPADGRPDANIGISMIEFRIVSRNELPESERPWAPSRDLKPEDLPPNRFFGYSIDVPLIETPVYLRYLEQRLEHKVGAECIHRGAKIGGISAIDVGVSIVVNCAGIDGPDFSRMEDSTAMNPGRGVVILGRTAKSYAILDADEYESGKLMYIVPRRLSGQCVIGGSDTNDRSPTPAVKEIAEIVERCSAADSTLEVETSSALVGLRPLRPKGVRLELEDIDGRAVIHNYGHGGSGFTVSWGCAEEVARIVATITAPATPATDRE
jgi:D-amino-acid oxidase